MTNPLIRVSCHRLSHIGGSFLSKSPSSPLRASVNVATTAQRASKLTFSSFSLTRKQKKHDLDHAVEMVQSHDPVGYLPGRLLPTRDMSETYYAVRSFWVETGLRFGTTAIVPPNSSPAEHIEWWQEGINLVYDENTDGMPTDFNHPTLRLLQELVPKNNLKKHHLDNVLLGRSHDLDLKQYATLDDLVQHAERSCVSLLQLVLESSKNGTSASANEAARLVGICHGLTNALRLSIPVVSITGKLVIPQDLCEKHNVKTPRYLLSALGQGDEAGQQALRSAVAEIVATARTHLNEARALRQRIFDASSNSNGAAEAAVATLIPAIASETFLNRLEQTGFDLTNRNLRNVGIVERASCSARMIAAYLTKTY
uniref:Uncharacterized protein n=1 Tax=Cyclophora tenuis TaxID=216820 RepID=A0A7S1D375_CYCTE|mmetsp:Transcript_18206/g.31025  ORF Transcript_18206/g.31025 Transcript_18206/m.31025 type:complete len:370 (+) Transcript_18206:279-1388(+)